MKVLDLFAGIGGFTLGLERAGFETVAFCEIEPYAQKVLRKNWPGVPIYDDVRDITADRLISDGIRVDVITGGFPCQDISVAGQKAGIDGERSGLWSECARLLGDIRPKYAIFENVTNLLNGERGAWFQRVLWDISAVGYDAEWHCIPASALGAHHHRDRVWIVAYPRHAGVLQSGSSCNSSEESGEQRRVRANESSSNVQAQSGRLADANHNGSLTTQESRGVTSRGDSGETGQKQAGQSEGLCATRIDEDVADSYSNNVQGLEPRPQSSEHQRQARLFCGARSIPTCESWASEPDVGRVAHGVPSRSHRLKCLGNAVVPAIPRFIGETILQHNELQLSQN